MRKGYVLLVLLLSVFLISGCKQNPPVIKENIGPIVTGEQTLVLQLNSEEPDWTKLVTATDDTDGNIPLFNSMIDSNVDLRKAGNYEVTYTIPDSEGKATIYTISVEVVDERVYTLSLYGAAEIDIQVFDNFIDPGVLALNLDGEETKVNVLGSVNSTVVGTYILTYSIDGFDAIISRTVNVIDTISPVLQVDDQVITIDESNIDWSERYTHARDNYDEDVVVVELEDNVMYGTPGIYTVSLLAKDQYDNLTIESFTVTISDIIYMNRTGIFDYQYANSELRLTFMAAAEKYLMNTLYGGVPLFASGSYVLFSPRLILPVEDHLAVMGYGTRFASMSVDDSMVLMYDGRYGNAGEYTYRATNSVDPFTFNHWLYDTSTDETYMKEYVGSLYDYVINSDETGYEVIPSMASAAPIAIDSHFTDTGKEVSTTWQIPLKEGLEWSYYDNGPAPTYVTDNSITAEDFIDTFKIAIDHKWFRAISGGNDFINFSFSIEGLQEYYDNEDYSSAAWEKVGINLVDEKIEFIFVNDHSEWDITNWLSSFVMSPIHTEMYEVLGTTYGVNPTNTAYSGPYVISDYETSLVVKLEKNPNAALPALDFYTHKTFHIIKDQAIAFEQFEAGKLETSNLPSDQYDFYKNHPGLRQIPGNTTFRIAINGTGSEEAQKELFPDSSWIPEPILANQDFKSAMFFAIDRQYLAEQVLTGRTTTMYLFSNSYFVDPEMGIPYRNTEQGQSVGDGLSPATHGYNFDAAHALFLSAVNTEITAGNLQAGTFESWTVIDLQFNYFSNSDSQEEMFNYIKTAFELAFVDDENYVKVELTGVATDFPAIYYNHMMVGEFDLSIGGISGSTFHASSFLDSFCSDNRGGFTLNWGIDTSTANIEIQYIDPISKQVYQGLWSYDAITSILNGEVYIIDGAEAKLPEVINITHTTPTTVSFTVEQFDSPFFKDITYSLETYDLDVNDYVPINGLTDIPVTTPDVTITGLLPGLNDYPNLYIGDYKLRINYTSSIDSSKSYSITSKWWMQPSTIQEFNDNSTETSLDINLVLHSDFSNSITNAELLNADYTVTSIAVTVDVLHLTASDLTANTNYVIKVTYDNGVIDYLNYCTPS